MVKQSSAEVQCNLPNSIQVPNIFSMTATATIDKSDTLRCVVEFAYVQ